MAVTAPRVGTSAFAETGFREMSKARVALQLVARPGKLSEMVGRSKAFYITVASNRYTTALAGDQTDVGYGTTGLPARPLGSIENPNQLGSVITTLQASTNKVSTSGYLIFNSDATSPKRNVTIKIDGTNFVFVYSMITVGGVPWHQWLIAGGSLYNFLAARVGRRLECIAS